jgi:aldehyde dehydrogenase (NAD+)
MSEIHRNFIGGDWMAGAETARNINPSDLSDVIGEYSRADKAQADTAIAAARAAFPAWSMSSVQDRANLLDAVGNAILARKDELGRLLSREEGKTLPEGVGEVARAGQIFKFFGGEALRLAGEKIQSIRPGVDVEITREPLGVVGIITPWNFPIAIPAWKIAPALCYGNCVVFKPAELVPGSAWALSEIIIKAGVPPGVFNLVMGRGSVVGETIINDPRVDAISFTGSVATGRAIAAKAIARMAKLQLEMGGKNPLVVLDDADLGVAVNCAVNGAFFSTGQRCTASSRLIVGETIHDRFVAALSERLGSLKVEDALTPGTDIGPVVDETHQAELDYIGIGCARVRRLLTAGNAQARRRVTTSRRRCHRCIQRHGTCEKHLVRLR